MMTKTQSHRECSVSGEEETSTCVGFLGRTAQSHILKWFLLFSHTCNNSKKVTLTVNIHWASVRCRYNMQLFLHFLIKALRPTEQWFIIIPLPILWMRMLRPRKHFLTTYTLLKKWSLGLNLVLCVLSQSQNWNSTLEVLWGSQTDNRDFLYLKAFPILKAVKFWLTHAN